MSSTTRRTRCRLLAAIVLALSAAPAQSQVPADPFNYTRTVANTYDSAGAVATQTLEPGNAPSCAVTSYLYDANGNVRSTTQANCAGASGLAVVAAGPRTGTATYAAVASQSITVAGVATTVAIPAGLFATSSANALSQGSSATYDPRFGAALTQTDPNALTVATEVDDFGRTVAVVDAFGLRSVRAYCVLASSGLSMAANSPQCAGYTTSEAPPTAVAYVHTQGWDNAGAIMGPFSRVYTDRVGRTVRAVTQSFDGANQPAGGTSLTVQDTVYDANGAKVLETRPYFVATGSTATSGTTAVGVTKVAYDVLGRVTTLWRSDPAGTSSQTMGGTGSVAYGVYGTQTVAVASIAYAGLVVTETDDKGRTLVTQKGADGSMLRRTDVTGAQVAYLYDAFGNLVQTKDALQNSITASFDYRGRRTQLADPDKGLIKTDFDAFGQLVRQESARQRAASLATTYSYDKLGRMTARAEPEYTSNWYYDAYKNASACTKGIGRLCETWTTHGVAEKFVYDAYGRYLNKRTEADNGTRKVATAVSYHATTGRHTTTTYPTGLRVNHTYTALGYPKELRLTSAVTLTPLTATPGVTGTPVSLPANTALWSAQAMNAAGGWEQTQRSSAVNDRTTFDARTGRITERTAGPITTNTVLDQDYAWDTLGNVASRVDNLGDGSHGAVSETFGYDSINRLNQYVVTGTQIAGGSRTVTLSYNALGMMLSKSDVGTYSYNSSGPASVRPHAPASVAGTLNATFTADADGNITSATGGRYATLAYAYFDRVASATGAGASPSTYAWTYDAQHQRIKEVRTIPSGTYAGSRTTWYFNPDGAGGLAFESEDNAPTTASAANPAITTNRHYLNVAGQTIGVLATTGALPTLTANQTAPSYQSTVNNANKLEYWHPDHLGSLAATSDHAGVVTARYAYDPFGKRRYPSGVYDAAGAIDANWDPAVNSGNARGFTSHETLDDIGIVNMNGRIYDATLGLFVQPDQRIANPSDLQDFNRYGYVRNNPLNATDPTGFAAQAQANERKMRDWNTIQWNEQLINARNQANWAAQGGFVITTAGNGSTQIQWINPDNTAADRVFQVSTDIWRDLQQGVVGGGGGGASTWGGAAVDSGNASRSSGNAGGGILVAFADIDQERGVAAIGYLSNYCSSGRCATKFEQFMYDWWPGYKFGTGLYNSWQSGSWGFGGWELADGVLAAAGPIGKVAGAIGQTFGRLGTVVESFAGRITGIAENSHFIDRALERGVTAPMVLETVRSPLVVLQQSGGGYLFVGNDAAVVLNKAGQLVTTYHRNDFDQIVLRALQAAGY